MFDLRKMEVLSILLLVKILVFFEASAEIQYQKVNSSIVDKTSEVLKIQASQTLIYYYSNKSLKIIDSLSNDTGRDYECVLRELQISKFGSKLITETEGYVLTLSALNQCYGNQSFEIFKKYANLLMHKLTKNFPLNDLDCVKMMLHETKPESNLINNFTEGKISKQKKKECENIFQLKPLEDLDNELKILHAYSCNTFTKEESKVVDFSLIIIHFEEDEKLRSIWLRQVVDLLINLFKITVECFWPDLRSDTGDDN